MEILSRYFTVQLFVGEITFTCITLNALSSVYCIFTEYGSSVLLSTLWSRQLTSLYSWGHYLDLLCVVKLSFGCMGQASNPGRVSIIQSSIYRPDLTMV